MGNNGGDTPPARGMYCPCGGIGIHTKLKIWLFTGSSPVGGTSGSRSVARARGCKPRDHRSFVGSIPTCPTILSDRIPMVGGVIWDHVVGGSSPPDPSISMPDSLMGCTPKAPCKGRCEFKSHSGNHINDTVAYRLMRHHEVFGMKCP